MKNNLKFKRVLLKLSGESLMGNKGFGIDNKVLNFFADEIKQVHDDGVQVGIVIGGGNIYRGLSAEDQGIDRVTGDQMGMLATVINSLALQNAIEKKGIHTRLMTAITMEADCRTLYKTQSNKTFRKRKSGYIRCRYRLSLFQHRYCSFLKSS
jgi:uridylate kinase